MFNQHYRIWAALVAINIFYAVIVSILQPCFVIIVDFLDVVV